MGSGFAILLYLATFLFLSHFSLSISSSKVYVLFAYIYYFLIFKFKDLQKLVGFAGLCSVHG